jgi:putative transposase
LIDLTQEANKAGARLKLACKEAGISLRTYKRWYCDGEIKEDQRPVCQRPEPTNKLTTKERQAVLTVCNLAEYAGLPNSP